MDGVLQFVGPGGIAVQAVGDGISVVISTATAKLTLDLKQRLNVRRARTDLELLHTEAREITLVGRDGELSGLDEWLASADEILVRCLTGQAGSGKTRLGIELCERAEKKDWQAGFARHGDLRENLSGWHWGKQTLVVVDYAAASAPALKEWLEGLAGRPPGVAKLRILLLERYAETDRGWWEDVFAGRGLSGRGAASLLDPPAPVPVQPLSSPAHRRALLAEVMAKAAALKPGSPVPALPAPDADREFDRRLAEDADTHEPLFLAMAGVVAIATGAPAALALSRTDLANTVAGGEARRLEKRAGGAGIAPRLLTHLAACVTLQGGGNADALETLIAEETAATGPYPPMPAEQVASALRDAFPAANGDGADAIRPDLIGEAFLLHEIGRAGRPIAKQAEIVARAYRRAGMAVVQSVLRTIQNFCGGDAEHKSLLWLDRLVGADADLAELASIVDALPEQTVGLRERAASVQERVVSQLRTLAEQDLDAVRPELARSLNNLANRLSELGRREAALASAEEAASLYRDLAARRPDAFRPNLAASFNTLANRLSELGRREEGLACAEEAVAQYRALAAQRPDAFRVTLAISLNNLANRLSDLGRREEALAYAEEAVALYRALAAERPDAFRPYLAMPLNNLANRLSDLGRREEALAYAEEAVALHRVLTAQRPDAFRPDLAMSLSNLANRLRELGRRQEAVASAEEAVALRRALVAQRPAAFRPDLAMSLWVLADCLDAVDRRAEGIGANAEAIRALAGPFAALPAVFAGRMAAMARSYLGRCEALGTEPDHGLLGPVVAVLLKLAVEQGKT